MSRGPKPKYSQQPPGVVQNWSALQCSKKHTEQCGYDHAPVTRGRMRAQFPLPHGPNREGSTELCGDDHAPVTRGRMRAQYPLPHGPNREGRRMCQKASAYGRPWGDMRRWEVVLPSEMTIISPCPSREGRKCIRASAPKQSPWERCRASACGWPRQGGHACCRVTPVSSPSTRVGRPPSQQR